MIELAKVSWGDVLGMLGAETTFENLDSRPYQAPANGFRPGPEYAQSVLAEAERRGPTKRQEIAWLSTEDIRRIHDEMIQAYGGTSGDIDLGKVDSALDRIKYSVVGGIDQFPTIIHKAASLMHSILRYHPFMDGQKRTGLSAAFAYLGLNGYYFWARDTIDEVHFAIHVASGRFEVDEIARWLAQRVGHREALRDQEVLRGLIPFAERQNRSCSACGKPLRIRRPAVVCSCGAAHEVRLNAALITNRGGKREVIVELGLRLVGSKTHPNQG